MEKNKNIFEAGNKRWGNRSKHGRDKIFKTPSDLWDAACEYFKWVDDNPLKEDKPMVVSHGSGGGSSVKMVKVNKMRPYTLEGCCLFLNVTSSYFRNFRNQLTVNSNTTAEMVSDFTTVLVKIEETISNQMYEGAAAGFLKENLVARKLGIGDKQTVTNVNHNSIPMTRDEIKQVERDLEADV